MRKLYAIGDIHGCYNAMINVLDQIEKDIGEDDAKIVFLGDYVDRGPDSRKVIEKIMQLQADGKHTYVFLRGNHEDMMFEGGELWTYNGGGKTLSSYSVDGEHDHKTFNEHRQWLLRNTVLMHRDGEYLFAHAGIDPGRKLDEQLDGDLLWSRDFNTYIGEYPENVFVVHGHTPEPFPDLRENQLNIDTGCVFWEHRGFGTLTAVRLGPTRGNFKFFKAREVESE